MHRLVLSLFHFSVPDTSLCLREVTASRLRSGAYLDGMSGDEGQLGGVRNVVDGRRANVWRQARAQCRRMETERILSNLANASGDDVQQLSWRTEVNDTEPLTWCDLLLRMLKFWFGVHVQAARGTPHPHFNVRASRGLSRNAERVTGHMEGRSRRREVRNRSVSSTDGRKSFVPTRTLDTTGASDTFRGILALRERRKTFSVWQACGCRRDFFQPVAFPLAHRPSRLLHQSGKGTRFFET